MKAALVCFSVLLVRAFAASSNDVPGARIVGGTDAERGQVPHLVSLQYCLLSLCQHVSGGAIIGSQWVLTAAHCVANPSVLGTYKVVAGILDLTDSNPERQEILVSNVIIHPDYAGGTSTNDLAVIRLATSLTFSDQVQPINLPDQDEDFEGTVIVSGWGSTGILSPISTTLQVANPPLISVLTCRTALDTLLGGQPYVLDSEANICTGQLTRTVSTCTGDDGGPVVDVQGETLIGIQSWYVIPCGTVGAPSVHTRVSHYSDWITDTISV